MELDRISVPKIMVLPPIRIIFRRPRCSPMMKLKMDSNTQPVCRRVIAVQLIYSNFQRNYIIDVYVIVPTTTVSTDMDTMAGG